MMAEISATCGGFQGSLSFCCVLAHGWEMQWKFLQMLHFVCKGIIRRLLPGNTAVGNRGDDPKKWVSPGSLQKIHAFLAHHNQQGSSSQNHHLNQAKMSPFQIEMTLISDPPMPLQRSEKMEDSKTCFHEKFQTFKFFLTVSKFQHFWWKQEEVGPVLPRTKPAWAELNAARCASLCG